MILIVTDGSSMLGKGAGGAGGASGASGAVVVGAGSVTLGTLVVVVVVEVVVVSSASVVVEASFSLVVVGFSESDVLHPNKRTAPIITDKIFIVITFLCSNKVEQMRLLL